jgi:hypothetical protein
VIDTQHGIEAQKLNSNLCSGYIRLDNGDSEASQEPTGWTGDARSFLCETFELGYVVVMGLSDAVMRPDIETI